MGGGISKRVGLRREKSFGNYARMLNTVEPQNSNSDNSNSPLIRSKFPFPSEFDLPGFYTVFLNHEKKS